MSFPGRSLCKHRIPKYYLPVEAFLSVREIDLGCASAC